MFKRIFDKVKEFNYKNKGVKKYPNHVPWAPIDRMIHQSTNFSFEDVKQEDGTVKTIFINPKGVTYRNPRLKFNKWARADSSVNRLKYNKKNDARKEYNSEHNKEQGVMG
jgi:hypothetical protein